MTRNGTGYSARRREKMSKKSSVSVTDVQGRILVDHNCLNQMRDPHARRLYHAYRVFLYELVGLLGRWSVTVSDGRVFIRLPEDRDGGIFMPKPGIIKRVKSRGKK